MVGFGLLGLLAFFALGASILVALGWVAMGKAPDAERERRMRASPNARDGVFVNAQPLWNDVTGSLTSWTRLSEHAEAHAPIAVRTDTAEQLARPAGPLRVTWLGHSTTLIEFGATRLLTDPFFGQSPFPVPSLGPQRWYPPPVALQELRGVDAVLISHDHYDHLDQPTLSRMRDWDTTFITPLGVGAHLEYWGIPAERIVELDWWQEHPIGALRVVCTPARHASGRQLFDQMRTLWAGYAVLGPERRVFFSGDTGLFDGMQTIGERYGPFDLVMVEVGAYDRNWPDWHIGPEQALRAHRMLRGKLFLPIHWGLFNLSLHGWTEPVERVYAEAERTATRFVTPQPGQVIDVDSPPAPRRWWPTLPFQNAAQAPIVSTKNGDPADRYR